MTVQTYKFVNICGKEMPCSSPGLFQLACIPGMLICSQGRAGVNDPTCPLAWLIEQQHQHGARAKTMDMGKQRCDLRVDYAINR